ncbi:efflux RND transporter permease subunit [Kangiella sediminilitoris]|uniref:Acriflavine resistance protein B n=1 Tax=Kangiella sediminilitoris TaxID=1144748 RepID=A0A1B3B8K2_9GAMM|nr:efflux RND transporter permease subunit [Kangiella sediminilitoris]AOE49134.1 acriflavine resistance protein B [Kangiella sediminilitoris]
MISWFARNPVAANLLMIVILIAGAFTMWQRVTVERFPSIEYDYINVVVPFRGATPEEVEQTVSTRIEEAVYDLEGIKELSSTSSEGAGRVSIEVDEGYNVKDVLDQVKSRVDALNTLPLEAEKPIISQSIRRREAISVVISGELPEKELRRYAEIIEQEIASQPGLSQIETSGVRAYEIAIEFRQDQLNEYNLTLQDIANAVNNRSLDLSAGQVRSDRGEILLRLKGQSYTREDFTRIPVLTKEDGTILELGDLATIRDGFEEESINTRFDGEPSIELEIYRTGTQSTIDVSERVKAFVEAKQDSLPAGVNLSVWRDRSESLEARLNTLVTSALQGSLLVILLLALFLRPSIAMWVSLGIPIAFAGGMAFMPELGISVNLISLFAFILVLGIVVDDAIVTGENIYNHLNRGEAPLDAAIKGTKEVAVPVTFGVITTMVAFLPLAFMGGGWGAFYSQIPYIVIPVLLFSLVESKLILPAHIGHTKAKKDLKKPNKVLEYQQRFAKGFEKGILKFYKPILAFVLERWQLSLAIFVGILLLVLATVQSGITRFVFFPRIQSELARATLQMPEGTPFELTDSYIERMTDAAIKLQDKYRNEQGESVIEHIFSSSGTLWGSDSASSSKGRVMFEIMPPEQRESTISSTQLVREWRELIGPLPGVETLTFRAEIGRSGDPVDVQLRGSNIANLNAAANDVKEKLSKVSGVFDIADSFSKGKQEIQFKLKPQAETLGLSLSDLARQVRSAYFGVEVQRIQRGREDVRVMLRLAKEERGSLEGLNSLLINTPSGGKIPLSQVAELSFGKSPATIYRIDRQRTLNITADVDKENSDIEAIKRRIIADATDVVANYPGVSFSLEGEAREQEESNNSLMVSLTFVLFAIYILLAIPFKSYAQPFVVMVVIPFGAAMATIGHWIMGMPLSIMSMMGMLALTGVVVNDSLVLVDYINQQRRIHGETLKEAVLHAGVRRLRPVMLTSFTTFAGLMPLIFDKSTQAQFLIPMAVSLGFGILLSTVITLVLVPLMYYKAANLKHAVKRGLRL